MHLQFDAEVVDEQRLLNGTRYVSIEGVTSEDVDGWSLTLSYAQPKETDADSEEGDLTLSGPLGTIVAELESGRAGIVIDENDGEEREVVDLSFRVSGGDGSYADGAGEVRVAGTLLAAAGPLDVLVSLD